MSSKRHTGYFRFGHQYYLEDNILFIEDSNVWICQPIFKASTNVICGLVSK